MSIYNKKYYTEDIEYIRRIDYITNCDSLNRTVQNGIEESDSELQDFLESETPGPEQMAIEDEKKQILLSIMKSCLSAREFLVLYKRYGFEDGSMHTLDEIGKAMNITRERIRQVEDKALMKLKKKLIKLNIDKGDVL